MIEERIIRDETLPTLVHFHGTGGDERHLLGFAELIAPSWNTWGLRGEVNENGALRFFRRFAEGQLDYDDMVLRAREIEEHLSANRSGDLVAVGYSNGANTVAALAWMFPKLFRAAIMLRPMDVAEHLGESNLDGLKTLVLVSESDSITPGLQGKALADRLGSAGADSHLHWVPGGHRLSSADVRHAQDFIQSLKTGES